MKNLIEQSFLINNNCANVKADGTTVPMHQAVTVKIKQGEYNLYYSICRGNGISESYITMQKIHDTRWDTEKSYYKFYDDNAKFERAIKRIERMVSSVTDES